MTAAVALQRVSGGVDWRSDHNRCRTCETRPSSTQPRLAHAVVTPERDANKGTLLTPLKHGGFLLPVLSQRISPDGLTVTH